MNEGQIGSMRKLGVTESYKLKRQVVVSASEATEMILRYVLAFFDNLDLFNTWADLYSAVWTLFSVQHRENGKHIRI